MTRRRPPRAVWAAVAAFVGLSTVWSLVAPLTEAPDEQTHLGFVLHLAEPNPYPDYDEVRTFSSIVWLCRTWSASTTACPRPEEFANPVGPVRRHPAADAPPKDRRLAWDDEGGAVRLRSINQMGQHPPLYYTAMATVLRAERALTGGDWSLDRELALLRLLNVLLVAPIPLLAWWAAARFGLAPGAALAAACATLALPMLTHIGSALNNDNLVAVLGALLIALLAGVVRGDRSLRTAALAGVALGLGLLSKSLAAVFAPLVVVAYLVGWWELRRRGEQPGWRSSLGPLALAGGATVALAGWWYLRVHARTGQWAPSIESRNYRSGVAPPGFQADLLDYAGEFAKLMNVRVWGSFGWHSLRFGGELSLVLNLLVASLLVVALWPREDAGGNGRAARAFLLLPTVALGGFVFGRAWNLHSLTGRYPFIQGRYLLAGVVGLLVLVAIALHRLAGRWAPTIVVVVAGALQGYALSRALITWWGGPGLGPRGQLRAVRAWSGWPDAVVHALFVGAAVAVAWLVVELVLDVRSRREVAP
jgi:hypothetical protein